MAKFKSFLRNLSITICVDGTSRLISFIDRGYPFNMGFYTTDDEKEIEALKNNEWYGRLFSLIEESKPVQEEKEEHVYAATYPDVKRTQEANKILINDYGVDKDTLTNKAAALEAAEKLNISFPNL